MISTNADTKELKCVECTFKTSLTILSQDFLGVSVFRSPDFYFCFAIIYLLTKLVKTTLPFPIPCISLWFPL